MVAIVYSEDQTEPVWGQAWKELTISQMPLADFLRLSISQDVRPYSILLPPKVYPWLVQNDGHFLEHWWRTFP
jgi:hypothetical protein